MRREQSRLRREIFLIKKENERLAKDMEARQAALEKLGIKENFDFEDHQEIYSFADHSAPINQPPIKGIDCTVPPPVVTSYPKYPISEYSTRLAFNVYFERAVPRLSPQHESQHERAAREFRARRAKAILQMHVQAFKSQSIE